MPPHPLTNFEIQKCYQNEPRFNEVYSIDNFRKKVKDGAYAINLDQYAYVGAEHVPNKIENVIGNKNIKPNAFRIQANNSIMCGNFCTGFTDFMLEGKNLIDYSSSFSPYDFEKNYNIILSYYKNE